MRARVNPVLRAVLPFVLCVAFAELAFRASSTRDALRDSARHSALPHRYRTGVGFDPEIVFLGDSRMMYGVDPEAVSRAVEAWSGQPIRGYNLALPGAPPVAQLAMIDHVLDRRKPPRFAVIQVSPYMFSTRNDSSRAREALYTLYTFSGALRGLRAGMPVEDALFAVAHASSDLLRYRRGLVAHLVDGEAIPAPERISETGVASMPAVPWSAQQRAGAVRAREFEQTMQRPSARFAERELWYLEAAARSLLEARVEVAIVSAPVSSALLANDGPGSIVPEFESRFPALARRLGVAFYDHRRVGLLRDFEFSDGDHPSRAGALRYSSVLARDVLLPMVAPEMERDTRRFSPPQPHRGCELVEDFEATSQPGWRFEGHAFAEGPLSGSTGTQRTITGFLGVQLLNSYHPDAGDTARGIALSPPFVLDRSELRLRVGGGRDPRLRVELLVDGEVLRTARGDGTEALDEVRWNVEELRGRTARLRIIDASSTRSGHILVDHVERCWPAQEDGGPLGGS